MDVREREPPSSVVHGRLPVDVHHGPDNVHGRLFGVYGHPRTLSRTSVDTSRLKSQNVRTFQHDQWLHATVYFALFFCRLLTTHENIHE